MAANKDAAMGMLAMMLAGIRHSAHAGKDEPTFSADEIEAHDDSISLKVILPSGDRYRVSVEWLRDESP